MSRTSEDTYFQSGTFKVWKYWAAIMFAMLIVLVPLLDMGPLLPWIILTTWGVLSWGVLFYLNWWAEKKFASLGWWKRQFYVTLIFNTAILILCGIGLGIIVPTGLMESITEHHKQSEKSTH